MSSLQTAYYAGPRFEVSLGGDKSIICSLESVNICLGFILLLSESESEVAQLCPSLCDPMGCSPPDSSVPGILQARILEWVAISYSRGSSQARDRIHASCVSCICR